VWRICNEGGCFCRCTLAAQHGSTSGVHSQTWSTSDISLGGRGCRGEVNDELVADASGLGRLDRAGAGGIKKLKITNKQPKARSGVEARVS